MNKAKTTVIFALFLGIILTTAIVLGQPSGPDTANPLSSERGNASNPSQEVTAESGNVSEVSIDKTTVTKAWQGYYGNITGSITLEDASGNVFYNWSGLGSLSGEVYASRNDTVEWSSIGCANDANITNENSFLGKSANDPDSVNRTFSKQNHDSFDVGSTSIGPNNCSSTNAYDNSGSNSVNFQQVLLNDNQSHMVYTTLIDENQAGFNNVSYDFELLVGENGNATNSGTTPYYFYIELS